ncbi:MAG: NCS2 family permease [Lachnospiraceae bacterium]|nr:NCS2 family permease [Lachnospiraceae bacterium]
MRRFLEKIFKIKENNTSIRIELLAGLTSFTSMVYILIFNANLLSNPYGDGSNPLGISFGAVYISTALAAVVGNIFMSLVANAPFAQATGVGLTSFFVYTVCLKFGYSYANALLLVLIGGVLFVIISSTKLKRIIIRAIPYSVKVAMAPGVGLFVTFIALQNSGIIVASEENGASLGSFNFISGEWKNVMPLLVAFVGFFVIGILSKKKVKRAILIGILVSIALYYLLGLTIDGFYEGIAKSIESFSLTRDFEAFGTEAFLQVFKGGFDFGPVIAQMGFAKFILVSVCLVLTFLFTDIFDSFGFIYGVYDRYSLLAEENSLDGIYKTLRADAMGSVSGALLGSSTVTTYVESASGVASGAKTGLTPLFVAVLFLISMFFSPLAALIPNAATAGALIYVGVILIICVKKIDWGDLSMAVPAFLTIALIPFCYNVAYGLAFGMIAHIVINIFMGNIKKIRIGTWIVSAVFLAIMMFTR